MTTSTGDFGWNATWMLAQDGSSTGMFGAGNGTTPTTPGTGQPAGATPTAPGPGNNMIFLFMLPLVALVLLSMWMNRKEKRKREALMSSVGKNDQVLTVGGVIGTVTEIYDDRIVLRVDDNTKTKISFARSSIQQVLKPTNAPVAETSIETKGKAEKANA